MYMLFDLGNKFSQRLVYASGVFCGAIYVFLSARMVSPSIFGDFVKMLSIVQIVSVASTLKYELLSVGTITSNNRYISLLCSMAVSFISCILFYVVLQYFGFFSPLASKLSAILLFIVNLYDIVSYGILSSHSSFALGRSVAHRALKNVSALFFLVVANSLFTLSSTSLLLVEVLSRIPSLVFSYALLCRIYSFLNQPKVFLHFALSNFHSSLLSSVAWSINNSYMLIIPVFISYSYGNADAGLYAFASRLLFFPESFLAGYINQSFLVSVKKAGKIFTVLFRWLVILTLITVVYQAFLFLGLTFFPTAILGVKYEFNSNYALLFLAILPLAISQLFTSPFYIALNILNLPVLQLLLDIARILLLFAAISISLYFNFHSQQLMLAISTASCISAITFYISLFNFKSLRTI